MTCEDLFADEGRCVPLLVDEGLLMLSEQGCSCQGRTCTLRLLSEAPAVKTDKSASMAVKLGGDHAEHCDPTIVCPNMDACSAKSYGNAGCGWDCTRNGEQYWCSDTCSCNQEEAVTECATNHVCPGYDSCNPISYGEYGCGYGCMRGPTFFFCSDDCQNCNT